MRFPCAALCAKAGLKKLLLSIDDLLLHVYYHFKNFPKRCEEFSTILQKFDNSSYLGIEALLHQTVTTQKSYKEVTYSLACSLPLL